MLVRFSAQLQNAGTPSLSSISLTLALLKMKRIHNERIKSMDKSEVASKESENWSWKADPASVPRHV